MNHGESTSEMRDDEGTRLSTHASIFSSPEVKDSRDLFMCDRMCQQFRVISRVCVCDCVRVSVRSLKICTHPRFRFMSCLLQCASVHG